MVRQRAIGRGSSLAGVAALVSGLSSVPAPPVAAAVEQAWRTQVVQVHVVDDDNGPSLYVYGTDMGDGIWVEPTGERRADLEWLRVGVGLASGDGINLVDEAGICAQASPKEVVCPDDLDRVVVSTGAGGDSVFLTLGPDPHDVTVDTGAGNDRMYVINGAGALSGVGTSFVRVQGGDGNDDFSGGLHGDGDNPDQVSLFIGGPGGDEGKGATLARGGRGDDILTAQVGGVREAPVDDSRLTPARLRGGAGDDILRGALGDDELWGGPGSDKLTAHYGNDVANGGNGSDVIDVDDGKHDDVNCGQGADLVHPDSRDSIVRCETTL